MPPPDLRLGDAALVLKSAKPLKTQGIYETRVSAKALILLVFYRIYAPTPILGELVRAEAAERQSRSIRYRLGIAGLPEMKDLDSFRFDLSPVNEALVRSLHQGAFLTQRRNAVLVGGTSTGKTHLSITIAAHAIRAGTRARFCNAVDLVNRPEAESRNGKAGMLANQLRRLGQRARAPDPCTTLGQAPSG